VVSRRVLVITTDPLTERMPGPAIRAWHLAEVLAHQHRVTVASSVACDRTHPAMDVRYADDAAMEALAAETDVIVGPGSVVRRYPGLAGSRTPLVIDMYGPAHLENLEPDGHSSPAEHAETVRHLTAVVTEDLVRGDFFLCASDRQRDFWLGSLAVAGRINPATYADDPRLERLIAVVPFGLSATPPTRRGPGLRQLISGIGPDDPVLVWGGGVYNWFDPASLVRAVALTAQTIPNLRLVFLGMHNPNPNIPEMGVATEVRALAGDLGVAGIHVFFNDGWVPYDQRADYLLDADIGVSTHLDHIETRFSFRTRVLDYLWAGLPTILTEGDVLADLVRSTGAGVTVPPANVAAIAAAIQQVLAEPPSPTVIAELAERFHWDRVAAPLLAFCADPRPAPDRADGTEGNEPSPSSADTENREPEGSPASRPARANRRARFQPTRLARGVARRLRTERDRRRRPGG
jgi:glycosyltransferase involved in cell wall biosynthesis